MNELFFITAVCTYLLFGTDAADYDYEFCGELVYYSEREKLAHEAMMGTILSNYQHQERIYPGLPYRSRPETSVNYIIPNRRLWRRL